MFKEIEYKYWASDLSKENFLKRIESIAASVSNDLEMPEVIYVVSCDDYYNRTNGDHKDFVRFRKGGGGYELTLKRKEKENVVRTEINLNVTGNEDSAIVEFLTLSGYEKSFQVYKEAWIWNFPDCDLSYYTLSDGRSVIELEAVEYSSVKDGVKVINKWEKLLKLTSLEKESASLYEIFTEENKIMEKISNI
jgi:adenylate cyclase class IV